MRARQKVVLCVLSVAMVGIFILLRLLPRTPLDRAVLVARSTWVEGGIEYPSDCWAAPNRMVGFSDMGERTWNAHLHDLRTGRTEQLDGLKRLSRSMRAIQPGWSGGKVSPDGKWLLWGVSGSTGLSAFYVAELDGTHAYAWRNHPRIQAPDKSFDTAWRGDSRSWISISFIKGRASTLRIYPLRKPETVQIKELGGLPIQRFVIGTLRDGRIVTADSTNSCLTIFDPKDPARSLQTITLGQNPGWETSQVAISPDGRRLARLTIRPVNRFENRVARFFQDAIHRGRNTEVRVSASDLRRDNDVELGRFEAVFMSHGGDSCGIYGWQDDGRNLLFQRGDSILKIKVPR